MKHKKLISSCLVLLVIGIGMFFGATKLDLGDLNNSIRSKGDHNNNNRLVFDKNQYSINDPASVWVVVNKGRVLPADYVPADLVSPAIKLRSGGSDPNMMIRKEAATALETMNSAVNSAIGSGFMLTSGYRSYQIQSNLYNSYVKSSGQARADATSAHPGHSEHQTGWAADVEPINGKCQLDKCFADTPEGLWLAENATTYGFVIRYQEDTTDKTGYDFEPWHIRYVGIPLATELQKTDQTLEEFFGLAYYINYPLETYKLGVTQ